MNADLWTIDRGHQYALDVVADKIVAGHLVRLACERYLRDLDDETHGYLFDVAKAERAIGFFRFLRHSKGAAAGKVFVLEPWQVFIVMNLFGWVDSDGFRRFRTAYLEVGRKNGKSTLLAGLCLFLLFIDGEGGAEVYAAATKRDQAKIIWGEAERMVRKSPLLRKRLGIHRSVYNIHHLPSNSKLEPLSADYDTLDGLNSHGLAIDELHAHPDRGVLDVLVESTAARDQPLTMITTTAGSSRTSVCWQERARVVQVVEGKNLQDETVFGYIASIDRKYDGAERDDDWQDPKVWAKANPNLGVSVNPQYLAGRAKSAKQLPGLRTSFRRKHLDEWLESEEREFDLSKWDACAAPADLAALIEAGRECYLGIDLASKLDLSAVVAFFPPEGDLPAAVVPWFFVPELAIDERSRNDRVPYIEWRDDGHIIAADGGSLNQDEVVELILDLVGQGLKIKSVPYDPRGAEQLAIQLDAQGLTVIPVLQSFANLTEPMQQLHALIVSQRLAHGGHPVLRWCVGNVEAESNMDGHKRPSKRKSRERIDGVSALLTGMSRWVVEKPKKKSRYEDEGLLFI